VEETVHHPFAIGHYYNEPTKYTTINLFGSLLSINPKQNCICYIKPKELCLEKKKKLIIIINIKDFVAETLP